MPGMSRIRNIRRSCRLFHSLLIVIRRRQSHWNNQASLLSAIAQACPASCQLARRVKETKCHATGIRAPDNSGASAVGLCFLFLP